MDKEDRKKDFNIYYLNLTKVYEMAMMINNVILTKIEKDNSKSFEEEYGFTSSIEAKGSKNFLDGIKSSLFAETKESSISTTKVVESLDVKTTKSILLRRIIERCSEVTNINSQNEGDLIKIDNVKLQILDEETLRQFLLLRRDALKGMRVEGMEVNNLISSMLQDYAYILKGSVKLKEDSKETEIVIKIPMEIQSEFENKYSINDLLIGHVSIVGIYKGEINEGSIMSNTLNYFQDNGERINQVDYDNQKIIKSNSSNNTFTPHQTESLDYHFIDTLAIIQDVSFFIDKTTPTKLHWWNKIGIWLSKIGRK